MKYCVIDLGMGFDAGTKNWAKTQSFLKDCGVPLPWINDALALRARSEGNADLAYEKYIEGRNWQKAHEVLIDDLVPSKFSRGCKKQIARLKKLLNDWKEESKNVSGWKYGGAIMKYYFDPNTLQNPKSVLQDCLKFMPDKPKLMDGHLSKNRIIQRR